MATTSTRTTTASPAQRARAFLAHAAALRTSLAVVGASATALVPCGRPHCEHFVPPHALAAHLRRCHRIKDPPRPPGAREFLYPRHAGDAADPIAPGGCADGPRAGASGSQQPGLAPELPVKREGAVSDLDVARFAAAVISFAPDAGAFYERVRAWRAVPTVFVRLPPLTGEGNGSKSFMDRSKLERWLTTEVARCLAVNSDQPSTAETSAVETELVEYVTGLLEHPDYCESTLLSLELNEFLGDQAAGFVLALWKFLVVEIGLSLVFNEVNAANLPPQQADAAPMHRRAVLECTPARSAAPEGEAKTQNSHDEPVLPPSDTRDYKRRRASYRGKVGTKTGRGALRELIAKHMAALSQDEGGEFIMLATTEEQICGGAVVQSPRSSGSIDNKQGPAASWWKFTDALRVRDMDRHGGPSLTRWQSGECGGSERDRKSRSRSKQQEGRRNLSSRHRGESRRSRSSSPRRSRRSRSRSASGRRDRDSRHRRRRSRSRSRSQCGRVFRRREHHDGEARRSRERRSGGGRHQSPR